jgi:hypothetical protein
MVLLMQALDYDVFEPLAIEFCARVSPIIHKQAVFFCERVYIFV